MKQLLLLRHAKSSWNDETLPDHDRPLNKRGHRTAPLMGELLKAQGLIPERWLSSTALRARSTAELVAKSCDFQGEIELRPELYHAAPEMFFTVLNQVEDSVDSILVIGHNPGMEELLELLTGQSEHFPTAALAVLEMPIDTWAELNARTTCRLLHLWRPKELS